MGAYCSLGGPWRALRALEGIGQPSTALLVSRGSPQTPPLIKIENGSFGKIENGLFGIENREWIVWDREWIVWSNTPEGSADILSNQETKQG